MTRHTKSVTLRLILLASIPHVCSLCYLPNKITRFLIFPISWPSGVLRLQITTTRNVSNAPILRNSTSRARYQSLNWNVHNKGEQGVSIVEIGERQDCLHHIEPYFSATFEQMSIGIAYATLDGHWLQVNHKLCEITGYTQEELLATTFQALTYPEDLAECLAITDLLLAGDIPSYTLEKRYIRKNGLLVWINFTVSLVHDEKNTPQYLFGIIEDIDERKRVETERNNLNANLEAIVAQRTEVLRKLNTELQRSNQELQDFAYIASHDLQEPLRKIQAFGDLLEEEYGSALGDGKAYLDRMRNAAGRMRILNEDLLTFSRGTTKAQPFTQVDLVTIVHEVIDDLEPRLRATQGRIEVGELPTIEADPQQMYQL